MAGKGTISSRRNLADTHWEWLIRVAAGSGKTRQIAYVVISNWPYAARSAALRNGMEAAKRLGIDVTERKGNGN